MEQMFNVSSNPHVRARMTTAKIMQLVVIALLPAALMGIYNHGLKALAVLVVSTGSAALAEWLYDHFMHKKNTVKDFSAVVTGLLIGLNMPAGIPLWIPVLGSIFAIIVVKQLFGGLGQNFMNPALAARCFLMISFAGKMTDFSVSDSFKGAVDGVTGATPLAALRDHGFVAGSSVPGNHRRDICNCHFDRCSNPALLQSDQRQNSVDLYWQLCSICDHLYACFRQRL